MKKRGRPKKSIICINDGIVYRSVAEAAKAYNVTQGGVSKQLNGQRKSIKGYYFKEISGIESDAELKKIRNNEISIILKGREEND